MDLNLFENKKTEDNCINQFIEELKNALENTISQKQNKNEKSNVLDEYNIYEKKKIFLDNKSRKSNELAWIMDDNSVCISEDGDGGPISISEIDLPNNAKVGDVYEKIDEEYVYNPDITSKLKDYFGSFAEKALQEVQTLSRKNSLNFYNKIILLKENNIQLETFLNINHLNEENIFNFIIQNKFLYSKEKGALIKIFSDHYGHSLTMEDILILLQEMLERKLTIEEILKEKEIPKKEFEKIYSSSKENNPLLWQEISSSLNQNSKRRYLKLIHLSYKVLRTPLSSKEEYNQLFSKTISFDDLLEELKNTELYDLLLDKASTWKDYDEFATYKKLKIKNS